MVVIIHLHVMVRRDPDLLQRARLGLLLGTAGGFQGRDAPGPLVVPLPQGIERRGAGHDDGNGTFEVSVWFGLSVFSIVREWGTKVRGRARR